MAAAYRQFPHRADIRFKRGGDTYNYLGKGRFQRRDFRLDNLTIFGGADSLFAQNGKHEIFKPTKIYPPMTVGELATLAPEVIA